VPSLNERREDIPLLANFFAEKIAKERTIIKNFEDKAIKLLRRIRLDRKYTGLRRVVERLIILGEKISENKM
jgi:DNA-binding NtrC family response regulator